MSQKSISLFSDDLREFLAFLTHAFVDFRVRGVDPLGMFVEMLTKLLNTIFTNKSPSSTRWDIGKAVDLSCC